MQVITLVLLYVFTPAWQFAPQVTSHYPTSAAAPGGSVQAAVNISNFKFEPKVLRVKVGTTVTWTNTDGTHTAVADGENFSSPTLNRGQTFSHKFTKRGKYPYYCSFHGSKGGGNMAGTIIVVP